MFPKTAAIARSRMLAGVRSSHYLTEVPMGAADPILGIAQAFKDSKETSKVNLSVGAYRDDQGKPYILPSVDEAERRILARGEKKEYAPIDGSTEFVQLALKFAYGDHCEALSKGHIAGVQTLSGTGACRVAGEFYSRFLPAGATIYMSEPTWGNHVSIMKDAGLQVKRYRYWNPQTKGLDFNGLLEDVQSAPKGSIFLMHACAHNPTGVDPSEEEWDVISEQLLKHEHHVLMDCAYQGFASGDAEKDAAVLRKFVDHGHSMILAQSFAKNFGLYGERVGTLSVVCNSPEEAACALSQLKLIIRPMYSNPPIHGALIISEVLKDPELRSRYYLECKGMQTASLT